MKKKLLYTTVSSLIFQILTIICGFILPRLFIQQYGSEINGLVASITQFLSIIAFLELGVGAVLQSALYKPLADNDRIKISAIQVTGNKFFKRIAYALAIYVGVLVVVYPNTVNQNLGWLYTAMLIFAISISSFAQYYFGLIDRILLVADQRGYISYTSQIVTLLVNTIACVIMIKCGFSIHVVKLTTSIIYLARPILIRIYVNKHYHIDWKMKVEEDPVKQKWSAVSQHVAHIVLNDTDTIVLSFFSSLSNVSIYSIYYMIVNGVKTLFLSTTNGFQSVLGELWAKKEHEKLYKFYGLVEYVVHTFVILIFTDVAILIIPFVSAYTEGIRDVNYIQPAFALLLVIAHASHCLRIPYHIMIKAAGHYSETQKCHIIAAGLNIIISIVAVKYTGLIGVAIGTLVAMVYQTIWMAVYCEKVFFKGAFAQFSKRCFIDVINVMAIYIATIKITLLHEDLISWFLMAVIVFLISVVVCILLNWVFSKNETQEIVKFLGHRTKKRDNNLSN